MRDHGHLQAASLGDRDRVDHQDTTGGVHVVLERVDQGVGSGGDRAHVVHSHRQQLLGAGFHHVHADDPQGR